MGNNSFLNSYRKNVGLISVKPPQSSSLNEQAIYENYLSALIW